MIMRFVVELTNIVIVQGNCYRTTLSRLIRILVTNEMNISIFALFINYKSEIYKELVFNGKKKNISLLSCNTGLNFKVSPAILNFLIFCAWRYPSVGIA
jgi:hypothetical protein